MKSFTKNLSSPIADESAKLAISREAVLPEERMRRDLDLPGRTSAGMPLQSTAVPLIRFRSTGFPYSIAF